MLNHNNLKMKNQIEEDNKLVLKKLIIDISASNSIMTSAIAVIQVFDKQGKYGRKKYNAVKRKNESHTRIQRDVNRKEKDCSNFDGQHCPSQVNLI